MKEKKVIEKKILPIDIYASTLAVGIFDI